ncbi:MAG: LPXTG cell wall anchor domain-containing protein, partial [Clostridiaceae bacterium]|nr:LPXTG cell wall anchor domain-containing protein [Clostridiaceae bacterium]
PTEPDDGSEPDLPHTGEGRSTSALGLALILAGLALGLFAWLQQRPRRRYNGR